ncbi:MAG: IS4 family transposase [Cyanobacteria bacterium P01_F01_bin.4]
MSHSHMLRDHARERHQPHVEVEEIAAQMEALLSPAIFAQQDYYRRLGLRSRILTLPVMLAAVLSLLWRNVPSVRELVRLMNREQLLWAKPVKVSDTAVAERFLSFPAELFEGVLKTLIPTLEERWGERRKRPVAVSIRYAEKHYERIWIADGSTLEALFRKLQCLAEVPLGQLGGKLCAVINLKTRLPVEVWFKSKPYAHDTQFGPALLGLLKAKTLIVLDRGFWDYGLFEAIIQANADFITRLRKGAKYVVLEVLSSSYHHRDQLIRLGTGYKGNPILTLRLVEVRVGKAWYAYLTSTLDPEILPPYGVADLYARRWRIEESFNILKRLLGLSYLWTGSPNGIKLQIWATWLFYSLLLDLADEVAEAVELPFERISLEMLWRSFYHFVQAQHRGEQRTWLEYVTALENKDLAVVKALRRKRIKPPLNLDPFPGKKGLTNLSSA